MFLQISKLFKEVSQSYYGQWVLYGIGGLVSVSVFPSFSLGWICLNIVIFHFINIASIVLHELGHAIAALCVGVEVTKIAIGYGENIWEFKIFGIRWEIRQIPSGGATYIFCKSTYFYRSRWFAISLFGPLTNLMLVFLTLKFSKELIAFNPSNLYVFPGIILGLVNALLVIDSLFPCYVNNIDGVRGPNDGLRMRNLPFLSKREVTEEVAGYWLFDGYILAQNDNYQKAIESFSQALHHNPDCAEAYQRRGNAYRAMKDNQRSINNYQQALSILSHTIKLEHLNSAHYYSRGMVYVDWMKIDPTQFQHAIEDLTKAINIDSTNHSFYFTRAAVYSYSGMENQAIEDFTAVIQINSNADAHYNRGVTYYQSNKYQSAIEDLDVAINLDSNSVSAYYNRGNAKYELEDKTGAFEDYDRAKFLSSTGAIISEDEHGFYAKGIAHIRLEDRVKAIEDLQRAEALCLEHGNASLLKQIRAEIEKIGT